MGRSDHFPPSFLAKHVPGVVPRNALVIKRWSFDPGQSYDMLIWSLVEHSNLPGDPFERVDAGYVSSFSANANLPIAAPEVPIADNQ